MANSSITSIVDNINNTTTNRDTSASGLAAAKAQSSKQDFLKLLTTQLQNQDPTAPTDTNQLTQQIATLSQVEQQIATNNNLEKLIGLFNTSTLNSVVGYIGKQVEADGDKGILNNGSATFVYNLEKDAASADVQILDASGSVVLSASGTKLAGRNEVLWDGVDSANRQLPDGAYTIKVTAKDSSGANVNVTTATVGVVTAIDSINGVTTLRLGDVSVGLDAVHSVSQPVLTNQLVSANPAVPNVPPVVEDTTTVIEDTTTTDS
jgi:flagellar basal-body rod modification protein FlgD